MRDKKNNFKTLDEAIRNQKRKPSNPNYIFQYSRRIIEKSLGIELSLIELVRLKELVIDSIKKNDCVKGHYSWANPIDDAIDRFVYDYYGVPLPIDSTGEANKWMSERYDFIEKNSYDGYREFWKKRQEEAHLP